MVVALSERFKDLMPFMMFADITVMLRVIFCPEILWGTLLKINRFDQQVEGGPFNIRGDRNGRP